MPDVQEQTDVYEVTMPKKPTGNLLIDEPPLIVLPSLATLIGLNEAIVVQQVHWNINNPRIGIEHNGRRWYRMKFEEWQEVFQFWSIATIKRAVASAEVRGVLLVAQLGHFDRDNSYSIDYENLKALMENPPIVSKCDDGTAQNEPMPSYQNDTFSSAQNEPLLNRYSETPPDSGKTPARRGVRLTPSGLGKRSGTGPKPWWECEPALTVKRLTRKPVPEGRRAAIEQAWAACVARGVRDVAAEFAAYHAEFERRGFDNGWWWVEEWLMDGRIPERGARRRVVELPAPETFATLVVRGESFTAAPRKKGLLSQYKKQNSSAPTV